MRVRKEASRRRLNTSSDEVHVENKTLAWNCCVHVLVQCLGMWVYNLQAAPKRTKHTSKFTPFLAPLVAEGGIEP